MGKIIASQLNFEWPNLWRERFNAQPENLILRPFAEGWLNKIPGDFIDIVAEDEVRHSTGQTDAASLCIHIKASNVQSDNKAIRTSIIFDYKQNRSWMRLKDIFFEGYAHQQIGAAFLADVIRLAIAEDYQALYVKPGLEGGAYWISRGANFQTQEIFYKQNFVDRVVWIKNLARGVWSVNDQESFCQMIDDKDTGKLQTFIERDDLFVSGMRLRRFLLQLIRTGECAFQFDNPRTQRCLLQRTGLDVAALLAARDQCPAPVDALPRVPERPAAVASFPHAAGRAEWAAGTQP